MNFEILCEFWLLGTRVSGEMALIVIVSQWMNRAGMLFGVNCVQKSGENCLINLHKFVVFISCWNARWMANTMRDCVSAGHWYGMSCATTEIASQQYNHRTTLKSSSFWQESVNPYSIGPWLSGLDSVQGEVQSIINHLMVFAGYLVLLRGQFGVCFKFRRSSRLFH